ncbi:cyclopropane-fatty-acyl-phospholipid synthase family protein [Rhizobium sp. L1K21]|uniref:SAM-dependent methyltransferase n=1 Tax=Rhizobium sp. L1K21 TaxID=2954933 RepID=UPI002092F6DF|nr:cyclopropane-fatty-acyl-phospholipid synthase family protein [Rhizobium sp. L1K21]MCO6185263.1 cyclopropane-fatty-acyl-phospholipid synthase family protein [Rhizobium sp. L1K21]
MTEISYSDDYAVPVRLKMWQRFILRIVQKIDVGSLELRFGHSEPIRIAGTKPGPDAALTIWNARPLWQLLRSGDLGFARSYIDGDWDTPDLGAFLAFGLANEAALASVASQSSGALRLADYLRHKLRGNSRKGSRRNIAYHYDLGNDFYGHWLDETMTYSSALYVEPDMDLAAAQTAKYARIVDELGITADDHVLEIGCGWGGFAEYAIAKTGCKVTGLTLSKEQAAFARERLQRAGLAERSDIRLEDYRDCQGHFDKIVSIEMFEAVGEEHWPTYFERVFARLKAGGEAMIQSITIDETRFDAYRRNADFIQAYIFPGGMLPSVTAFRKSVVEAGLSLKDSFAFGLDYARTLRKWDVDFVAKWDEIRKLGFDDRFYRMWRYYLHYCATGFDSRNIDVYQFRLAKAA